MGFIVGLAQYLAVQHHDGVCADDHITGLGECLRHLLRLVQRQRLHQLRRRQIGLCQFFAQSGMNFKISQPHLRQQLPAARGFGS